MADANNLASNFLFLSQASQKETSLQEIKFFHEMSSILKITL